MEEAALLLLQLSLKTPLGLRRLAERHRARPASTVGEDDKAERARERPAKRRVSNGLTFFFFVRRRAIEDGLSAFASFLAGNARALLRLLLIFSLQRVLADVLFA